MQRLDQRGIVGVVLLIIGVMALIGGLDTRSSRAADPDRYVFERDRHADFGELEFLIEDALGDLESMEAFEAFEGLELHMDGFAEELAVQIQEAMEHAAIRIDRDSPDTVWMRGGNHEFRFDTQRLARRMERMARNLERDVVRGLEQDAPRVRYRVREWRIDDEPVNRDEIEFELQRLQSEMRRLQRQLEDLESEGGI